MEGKKTARHGKKRAGKGRPGKPEAMAAHSDRLAKVSAEQLDLPAGFSSEDQSMLTLRDIVSKKAPALSFSQLTPEQQAQLTAERIRKQPKFQLGMIGAGIVDKERAIREVESLSSVGRTIIEIEQRTINRLLKKVS